MNQSLPARDRVHRETASGWALGSARSVSRAGGLVGGVANHRSRTKKAAGVESGGRGNRAASGSGFDRVDPLVADLLADDGQSVLLGKRAARAEHGPGSVFLPAHRGHDLLKRYATVTLEHRDIHPDLSKDADDLERRTRFMAEANRAYEAGDAEALRRILDEYQDGADAVEGEGVGAELIRIIRQISLAKSRVSAIEQELAALRQSEIALLKKQAEDREQEGGDLLAELATAVRQKVELAQKEYETLTKQGNPA